MPTGLSQAHHRETLIEPRKIMIIAGEASGDLHGARVVEALGRKAPDLFFFGIGGPALSAAGVRILVDAATLAVVGITEVFAKLPGLLRGMRTAKAALRLITQGGRQTVASSRNCLSGW